MAMVFGDKLACSRTLPGGCIFRLPLRMPFFSFGCIKRYLLLFESAQRASGGMNHRASHTEKASFAQHTTCVSPYARMIFLLLCYRSFASTPLFCHSTNALRSKCRGRSKPRHRQAGRLQNLHVVFQHRAHDVQDLFMMPPRYPLHGSPTSPRDSVHALKSALVFMFGRVAGGKTQHA